MNGLRIFTDPAVGRYHSAGHPEAPWRVSRTADALRAAGWVLEAPPVVATERDVLTVHTEAHWRAVRIGLYDDPDTPHHDGIHEIALTSLAGALAAADSAAGGTPAFSLMRPPGHHAGRERVAGFCYVNNMAIACARLIERGLRVAVLDVDVHHGDGTQDIALGRENWLYVSLHQFPLYPGTGAVSEKNCRNFPLDPFTDEAAYLKTFNAALEEVDGFRPDVVGVSAGFDTFRDCPLAQLRLEEGSYRRIGRMIAERKWRRFAVLEGGYAEALPTLIEEFLRGFSGVPPPAG